jgi:hypothetical protein
VVRPWISILVTSIRETTSGIPRRRVVEAAAAPAIAIVMTTGANLRRARAIAMTMTRGRLDVVLETTSKGQTDTDRIAITIPAGPTEIATIENAIARPRMRSVDMFTCLADPSASSFTNAIANTPCAAPNPGRSRPLVHSEWFPVVISETTMGARLIPGLVTCETCANKG